MVPRAHWLTAVRRRAEPIQPRSAPLEHSFLQTRDVPEVQVRQRAAVIRLRLVLKVWQQHCLAQTRNGAVACSAQFLLLRPVKVADLVRLPACSPLEPVFPLREYVE